MTRAALQFEIGAVALNGFSAGDSQRVLDGFRTELARAGLSGPPVLPERTILTAASAHGPERIGAAAARALIEALER
ncbi:MAG: hypothetical protein EA339_14990 [Rhodobacteraceae bacterium]|nr:MAG: hypothetical protein EA339_14990 [Paracoccaceae bacterium]